jgi:hypothetical protein
MWQTEVQLCPLLTLALGEGHWSTAHPDPTLGKEPQYPLNRKRIGPQNWSQKFGKEKNFSPLTGFEPQIIQPKHAIWFPLSFVHSQR